MKEAVTHSDLIYDVGMHRGEDTEWYLLKGFRVVAFEADPDNVAYCQRRFDSYVDSGQLCIVEGAIVDERHPMSTGVHFYRNDKKSVWGTVNKEWAERNQRIGASISVIEVNPVNFADAIERFGMPYFMKIDIEGADLVCLKALTDFGVHPQYVSIESSKTSFANIKEEIDLLTSLGYTEFQAVEQSEIPKVQEPPLPAREGAYVNKSFQFGSSGLFGKELPTDKWLSKRQVLRHYYYVRAGYFLLGDDGVLTKWRFKGASRVQECVRFIVRRFTKEAVPGWHDTHARHVTSDKG